MDAKATSDTKKRLFSLVSQFNNKLSITFGLRTRTSHDRPVLPVAFHPHTVFMFTHVSGLVNSRRTLLHVLTCARVRARRERRDDGSSVNTRVWTHTRPGVFKNVIYSCTRRKKRTCPSLYSPYSFCCCCVLSSGGDKGGTYASPDCCCCAPTDGTMNGRYPS